MFNPRPNPKSRQITDVFPPIMVRRLPRSSQELLLLLELNHPDFRDDPWNPVPHTHSGIQRDGEVYLCMQGLFEYNEPPLLTVAHYIDFFRQILEV